MIAINVSAESCQVVMPDLIRHPEAFEIAGFRISLRSSGMTGNGSHGLLCEFITEVTPMY